MRVDQPTAHMFKSLAVGQRRVAMNKKGLAVLLLVVVGVALIALDSFSVFSESVQSSVLYEKTSLDRFQELFQEPDPGTSVRTDLAHPYGTMRPADEQFLNPYNPRGQAVNPAPLHPYNNGNRPKAVLHREFEHNPYGNHLPWETGPAGALAKDIKRPDRLQEYRYVVDRDGEVRKWTYPIPESELQPDQITPDTIEKFSPLPKPALDSHAVARALINQQNHAIQTSFRAFLPNGAFHDSVVDGRTGQELDVPGVGGAAHSEVKCPIGLYMCRDASCVAHLSYCPGCDSVPVPHYCTMNPAKPSGWKPSVIGCEDEMHCGMNTGNSLFLPGEAVTDGIFGGGLA